MIEPATYREIVAHARAATGARLVVLSRFDPATQEAAVVAWASTPPALVEHAMGAARRLIPDFDPAHVRASVDVNHWLRAVYWAGEAVAAPFRELAAGTVDERLLDLASALLGLRHAFACPLLVEDGVAGSLAFYTVHALTEAQQRICHAFAKQAALTLEHARLAQAEQRRAAQAAQLAATLAAVGAATDVEGALAALLRGAIALLDGDHGSVTLADPKTRVRHLVLRLARGGALEVVRQPDPHPPGSFGAALLAGGPATLVEDFWALDPQTYPLYETMRRWGLRAAVNVPITAGGRRSGTLHVNHQQPGFFGPSDLALAEALAAHAGATIERARLEAARRDALAAREAALRQLAAQTEALARREAEAAALRELDRLKNEFLHTVSHELRTPLTLVYGYAELLQNRARALDATSIERMATQLCSGAAQLTRLVDDLLDFARIERGEVRVQAQDFDAVPLLQEMMVELRRRPGGERLASTLPTTAPVHADPARLVQVVSNLVTNALKYAPTGPITLQVEAPATGGTVRVSVVDRGPGIAPAEQSRIWEKFYRGAGVAGLSVAPGAGIGLAVVKALVEAQGGHVGLESAPGQGARFWFELPGGG